jgi:hypothetical protein
MVGAGIAKERGYGYILGIIGRNKIRVKKL